MRFLAIDYGERRTGLAVGDDEPALASPLGVIDTANSDERLRRIASAIEEQGPDALVLGLPLNMDGTDGPAALRVRACALVLSDRFGLPVHLVDERLTTAAADDEMNRAGLRGRHKKAHRDAVAAATILRDFLAQRTGGSDPDAGRHRRPD